MYAHTEKRNANNQVETVGSVQDLSPKGRQDTSIDRYGNEELGRYANGIQAEIHKSQSRIHRFIEPVAIAPGLCRDQPLATKSPGEVVIEFRDALAQSIWASLCYQNVRPTDSIQAISNAYIAASEKLSKIANQQLPKLLRVVAEQIVIFEGTKVIAKDIVKDFRVRAEEKVHQKFAMQPISSPGVPRIDVVRKGSRFMHQLTKEMLLRSVNTAATRFVMALISAHSSGLLGWVDVDQDGMLRAVTHRLRWVFERYESHKSGIKSRWSKQNNVEHYRWVVLHAEKGTVLHQRIQVEQELIEAQPHRLDQFSMGMPAAARQIRRATPPCLSGLVRVWEGTELRHSILACDEEVEPYDRVWEQTVFEWYHVDPIIEIAGFAVLGWSCHELKLIDRFEAMQTHGLRVAHRVVRHIPTALRNVATKSGVILRSSAVSGRVVRTLRHTQGKIAKRST